MTGAPIHFLLIIMAFAIMCMDLGLCIIYGWFSKFPWTKILIVFIASLLGCIGMQMLATWSDVSFSGLPSQVLQIIWKSLHVADSAFLLTFIAYFTTWIIAHPWRNPYKTIFFCCSAVYLAVGILSIIWPENVIYDMVKYILGGFVLFFCLFVILKNLKGIENRDVRLVCRVIIIAGLILIPVSLCGIFFRFVRVLITQIVYLAFGIIILVFLFLALRRHFRELTVPEKKPTLEEFFERFHITEREGDVIREIKMGKTAKEIAADLSISVNTVNNHIANIFAKTEVRSRIDLLNLIQEVW
ncbi:MAG: helix-turn-helix transcriptional regulator [Bullifex sp.]